jgi:hypothetical protein
MSKIKFDFVFEYCDKKQWKSLQFSNDDGTSRQIEYFFPNYSLIHHIPQLKSLSILDLNISKMFRLLFSFLFLTNLV